MAHDDFDHLKSLPQGFSVIDQLYLKLYLLPTTVEGGPSCLILCVNVVVLNISEEPLDGFFFEISKGSIKSNKHS